VTSILGEHEEPAFTRFGVKKTLVKNTPEYHPKPEKRLKREQPQLEKKKAAWRSFCMSSPAAGSLVFTINANMPRRSEESQLTERRCLLKVWEAREMDPWRARKHLDGA